MFTAVMKPSAIRTPPILSLKRSRGAGKRGVVLAIVVLTLGLLGVGGWTLVDRSSASGESGGPAPTVTSERMGGAGSWLGRLELVALEKQLKRAGYSINVDGRLDPVTKSALADYLRLSATHPLTQGLASSLRGTVITGRRDPIAWNRVFGLDRATKFVERPLTGPGGLLDANGNVRAVSTGN